MYKISMLSQDTIAVAKEIGFDEAINSKEFLLTWLREYYHIYITVGTNIETLKHGYEIFVAAMGDNESEILEYHTNSDQWDLEYDEALEEALNVTVKKIRDGYYTRTRKDN